MMILSSKLNINICIDSPHHVLAIVVAESTPLLIGSIALFIE
jgi:hypothetical protein